MTMSLTLERPQQGTRDTESRDRVWYDTSAHRVCSPWADCSSTYTEESIWWNQRKHKIAPTEPRYDLY